MKKFILSGVLVFAQPGSTAQLYLAALVSFYFFALLARTMPFKNGAQHGKAAELSTACAARGRGAPRGGGAWLAARVQTGEKRGRNGGLSTP